MSADYARASVSDGNVEIGFRRLPTDVDALCRRAVIPHSSWADDVEQRIGRWKTGASG
jgi:hypothetical protein